MVTHQILWQVSLNNGETHQEGKGKFQEFEGELSPWNKLLEYLKMWKLEITSICLINPKTGATYNLPSKGKNPNFAPFRDSQKPIMYGMYRCIAMEKMRADSGEFGDQETKEWYTVIKAQYPEYSLQIWVSEMNPKDSWTLVERN